MCNHRRLLLKLEKQIGGTIYWPIHAMNEEYLNQFNLKFNQSTLGSKIEKRLSWLGWGVVIDI